MTPKRGAGRRTGNVLRRPGGLLPWLAALNLLAVLGWTWWDQRLQAPAPATTTSGGVPVPSRSPALRPVPLVSPTGAEPLLLVPTSRPARQVAATNIAAPVPPTNAWRETLEAQVALARNGISPGSLDGLMGPQTAAAVRAFQRQQGLPASGALDTATRARLATGEPVTTNYVVTSADLARLQPLGTSWFAKSQQERLDFETVLELVAERFQAHPNLLRRLNPDQDWSRLAAGATVEVPHVSPPTVPNRAASLRILLADRVLQAFDERTNLLAHFPCSIGRLAEKRPVGELKVTVLAPDPNYTFDPEVFPESAEGRELGRKLLLQPGPNNPVGTVWIGLDRPGYGIHGTPQPEQVGRTESHGCFRLANWNAELLLKLAWVGLPVFVEP